MDYLNILLPVLLYIFGIILLIVLIILGIRLIQLVEKIDHVVDDVTDKVHSLNGLFAVVDKTSDFLSRIGDSVVGAVATVSSKIFKRSKSKKKEEDIYE